jgi:membrane associated rhomboid family serine protease
VIPLRDVIPSRTTPGVTIAIIALNALVWLYLVALPPDGRLRLLQTFGFVPAAARPLALLTGLFVHASWPQAIGNLWFLWIFGENVEDRMGHRRFAVFFALCGGGAALAQAAVVPDAALPVVGSGGAVAGVMGAYFVLYPQSRILVLVPLVVIWEIVEVPALLLLGFFVVLQLTVLGAIAPAAVSSSGVAFAGPAAGFVLGALGVLVFRRHRTLQWE